jgi:hypothetical protein
MRDLIAQATCDRDSLAYWSDTGRTYAVDELRRRRTRAGQLALIEEAGTRLNDRDLTTWTDNSGGSGSASAVINSDGSYRITLCSGDSYGGVLRESFTALASDGSFRCEAKLVSGSTQYLSIKFGSGDPTGQSDAINSPVLDPDTWTELTSSPVSGRSSVEFQARGPTESGVLDNTIEIDVRFVQVEQNPYPTSWIPGPGTARAADLAHANINDGQKGTLIIWMDGADWSAASRGEIITPIRDPDNADYLVSFIGLAAGNNPMSIAFRRTTTSGVETISSAGVYDGTAPGCFALRWQPGGMDIRHDGSAVASTSPVGDYLYTSRVRLGAGVLGGREVDRKIGVWYVPRYLSDAAVDAISDDLLARLPA